MDTPRASTNGAGAVDSRTARSRRRFRPGFGPAFGPGFGPGFGSGFGSGSRPDHADEPGGAGQGFRGLPPAVRLWFPVLLSFLVQVPPTLFILWRTGPYPAIDTAVAVALVVASPLLLIGARRFPGPVVAAVTAVAVADLLLQPFVGPPTIALGFAIFSGIFRGARIWVYASVVSGWLVAVLGGSVLGLEWNPVRIALVTAGLAVLVALAEGGRTRREQLREARERSLRHRSSVEQAERMRIARELHDVLAHSLSQIYVQAGVGLHLMDTQPDKTRESLTNIKASSKTALDEVRGVLAFLRSDAADPASRVPEPDLSALGQLVDSFRAHGIDVSLDNSLNPLPPARVQLALYRIVQESLTNVLRHAHASSARVVLEESGDSIRLTVTDTGSGVEDHTREASNGSGLLGMAERVTLLGGTFAAGNAAGEQPVADGFVVTVTIPRERS